MKEVWGFSLDFKSSIHSNFGFQKPLNYGFESLESMAKIVTSGITPLVGGFYKKAPWIALKPFQASLRVEAL